MNNKRKILTVALLSAGLSSSAAASPNVAPDDKQPAWRIELRASLYQAGETKAKAEMPRFRALCDSEGYPLVGNVANKGMRYEVADYCRDVRTAAAKPKSNA